MKLRCTECGADLDSHRMKDMNTCPHCGGQTAAAIEPLHYHCWQKTGEKDENNRPMRRCKECGETEP